MWSKPDNEGGKACRSLLIAICKYKTAISVGQLVRGKKFFGVKALQLHGLKFPEAYDLLQFSQLFITFRNTAEYTVHSPQTDQNVTKIEFLITKMKSMAFDICGFY